MIIHNCITFFCMIKEKIQSVYVILLKMQAHQEYFEQVANVSTDQKFNKDLVGKLLITLMLEKILRKFDTK